MLHHITWLHCGEAEQSSSNYSMKANFEIKITEVWAHRNAWVSVGTFGRDRINRRPLYTYFFDCSLHAFELTVIVAHV